MKSYKIISSVGVFIFCALLISCLKTEKKPEVSAQVMTPYTEPKILELVPGKSLGDVSIGESDVSLKSKGFELDRSYAEPNYMRRGSILVRLENQKSIQIYFGDTDVLKADYERLRFEGKSLPKNLSFEKMKTFFKDCDVVMQIGATLLYCEQRKIRLGYGGLENSRPGVSIVLPNDYDLVSK